MNKTRPRKRYSGDPRKLKRRMNRLLKRIKFGGYFLACNNHPAKCTEKYFSYCDLYGAGVDGISLIDGSGTSCSLLHCGPEPLTESLAMEFKQHWNNPEELKLVYQKLYHKKYEEPM